MKLLNRLSRLNDGASAVRLTELLLLLYSQTQEVYYDSHLLTLLATSDAGVELLHDFPKPTMPKDALELGKEFILPLALAASRDGNPYLMKIALTLASKWPARLDKEALQLILELCVRRIENGDRSAGRVELGLRLLGGMLKAGVDVERWVIVTMLRVLAENGDGSTLEWLRVAVMRAKLSRGRRSEEGPWLEDMEADTKKGGFGQETMEINLLLKCYTSRIGLDSEHKVGKIVDAINSMSKTRHGGSCKFTPDVWGWNEIVQVLALEAANDDMSLKRGGVWRVEALLNDMRSAGVEPNIATVTLCLAACRNTREILMWRRRVKDHWLKGRRLNSKWQSAVVAAFLKAGTIEEAEEFFITSLCMDISVLNEADWAADWLTSFNALLDFRARRSDGSGEAFCNAMLDWAHPSWSPPLAIDRRWHWPHIKAEMPLNVKTLNSVLTAIYHAKDIITRRPRREREQDLEKKSASRLPARVAAGISKSPGSESITVDSVLTVIDDCLGLPKYDTSVQSKYDRGKAWVARLRAMEVNPNQSTYDLLLKLALASVSTEDLSDVAFEFITDQAHNGVQLKPITFQIILESLSAAASQDRAVARSLLLKSSAWFHRMPALGVKHDEATPETYLALMRTAALASGDPAIALAWWERAHSEGVQLNECVAWRSVVMAWCIGGDLRAAASYAKRSPEGEERTGRGTDPATWCVVARAFMNAGKRRWALWCLGKVGRGNATKEVIETALDICLEGGKLWKDEFVAIKMWVGNRAPWKVCGSKDGRLRELVARKWGRRAHPLELGKSID
ncbi:hypothetical protein HK101_005268 [Irineochytrium annulatum]|nr:hypothetical protein HK101_005268 [Irineochytrium annulatum]